MVWNDLASVL
uniref:Uncharacterized protein n=1 Tax=Anguilla anguilla TaxID=7936 RepID=A0A0E9XUU0_ANGAN